MTPLARPLRALTRAAHWLGDLCADAATWAETPYAWAAIRARRHLPAQAVSEILGLDAVGLSGPFPAGMAQERPRGGEDDDDPPGDVPHLPPEITRAGRP